MSRLNPLRVSKPVSACSFALRCPSCLKSLALSYPVLLRGYNRARLQFGDHFFSLKTSWKYIYISTDIFLTFAILNTRWLGFLCFVLFFFVFQMLLKRSEQPSNRSALKNKPTRRNTVRCPAGLLPHLGSTFGTGLTSSL